MIYMNQFYAVTAFCTCKYQQEALYKLDNRTHNNPTCCLTKNLMWVDRFIFYKCLMLETFSNLPFSMK